MEQQLRPGDPLHRVLPTLQAADSCGRSGDTHSEGIAPAEADCDPAASPADELPTAVLAEVLALLPWDDVVASAALVSRAWLAAASYVPRRACPDTPADLRRLPPCAELSLAGVELLPGSSWAAAEGWRASDAGSRRSSSLPGSVVPDTAGSGAGDVIFTSELEEATDSVGGSGGQAAEPDITAQVAAVLEKVGCVVGADLVENTG